MSTACHKEPGSLDVIVVGLNVVDVLAVLPHQIAQGEKHEIQALTIQGGGPASNAACGLAMLGWRTGFLARLGDNTLSTVARTDFARYGVQPDLFIHDPAAQPAAAVVQIDPASAERTVFYTLAGYQRLSGTDVPADAIRKAKLVLVDGYEADAARAALQIARDTSIESVLDVETTDAPMVRELLQLGRHCILPFATACRLTGEQTPEAALCRLAEWTRGQLVLTDGTRGSWATDGADIIHQPAFDVEAIDTTGCGDAYHAAYASALLDGLSLCRRMEFASWVASRVALKPGGRTNLPTRQSLLTSDLSPLSPELQNHLKKSHDARATLS